MRPEAIRRLVGPQGEEMISWRLAAPGILLAAAAAGCFTHFVNPPPQDAEVDQQSPPTMPDMTSLQTETRTNVDQRPSAKEETAAAFQQADRGDPKAVIECASVRQRATNYWAHPVA